MRTAFSIIIPTLNEQDYLPDLLASIADQDFSGDYEVIVVDAASTDKTVSQAEVFRGKVKKLNIVTADKCLPRQRNIGAAKARYPYLLFIDADVTLPKAFLTNLAKRVAGERRFVALPFLTPPTANLLDHLFAYAAYVFFTIVRFSKPIVTGMCIITSKENHDHIGGFNERAIYTDDIEYGLRSVAKGAVYHIYYTLHAHASERRLKQLGRIKLGLLWLRWYRITAKHGPITNKKAYDYAYGRFSK